MKTETKQRVTAFVDPVLVKRAKVRGALEGLTISEVVEKAFGRVRSKLEKDSNQNIHLKFINGPALDTLIPQKDAKIKKIVSKHTKALVVPR